MKIKFISQATGQLGRQVTAEPYAMALYSFATALGFFIAAKIGVAASVMPVGIALFWPANAVLLAALLLRPAREWWCLAAAIVPAELCADMPTFSFTQALWFGGVNITEAVFAAALLRATAGAEFSFARLRNVALFGLLAVIVAAGMASLLGAAVYALTVGDKVAYWSLWRIWWFGDGLGLLIVTPVIHAWLSHGDKPFGQGSMRQLFELAALFAAIIAICVWVFSRQNAGEAPVMISPFVLLPLTVCAAIQFGIRGAGSANLIIGGIAVYFTVSHVGPFSLRDDLEATLDLQLYLAIVAFSSLGLAAFLQELRYHSEQKQILYLCIEAIDEGIMFTDARLPDNPIIYANPALERMTGFSFAEMQGKNPRILQGTDKQPFEMARLRKAITKGETVRALLRNYRKDGSLFWNSLTVSPVRNAKGELTHFIGIEHDVTSMKQAEEELRLAHDQLDQANRRLELRVRTRTRKLEEANRQLEILAATDPLTGAYNRRYFFMRAGVEVKRGIRYAHPVSLVALDIDFFKRINDVYGHAAGDKVLIELVLSVQATMRPSDILARFGGEEFVVLLPETDSGEAVNVAERIRLGIAALRVDAGQGVEISMTVSAGVATLTDAKDSIENLLKRADQAMYKAKDEGRNCLCTAAPFMVE
ncbi:MAG: diguanylate cyclase [Methylovulum sp.]|nr:diguanylate cyclase [Methylovulum sp.]